MSLTQGVNYPALMQVDARNDTALPPLEAEKVRKEAALIREAELRERMVKALERIAVALESA
jgi:hypothetical protein